MKLISGIAGGLTVSILIILLLQISGIGNQELAGWEPIQTDQLVQGDSLAFSTSLKNFGFGLFTKYMLPLQIAGFLLLAAMVGVIVLSKKSLLVQESD